MLNSQMEYAILIVFLALLFDTVLGEPPHPLHPVVWMGGLIAFLDRKIPRGNEKLEKILGVFLGMIPIFLFTFTLTLLLAIARKHIGTVAWLIASALLFKTTFAVKSMHQHALPILEYLSKGDIENARKRVAMMVSRNVKSLDREHIISAAIESISENIVDGITSPCFFLGIGGIPIAITYRVINTLDAMVGYQNNKYKNVGWFSAKLDDLANWFTARFTVFFIALAALLLRKNWRLSIRVAMQHHGRTRSPNSGWPIAAMAGALNIKLEKINQYVIGEGMLPRDPQMIQEALKIMKISSLLFLFFTVLPLYIFLGIHVQLILENFFYDLIWGAYT